MTNDIKELRDEFGPTPAGNAARVAGFSSYRDVPKLERPRIDLIARDNVVLIIGLSICRSRSCGWLAAHREVYRRCNPWALIHAQLDDVKELGLVLADHPNARPPDKYMPADPSVIR